MLRLREVVDQGARQDIDELDLGVAHHEPAGVTCGHRDLQGELDRRPGRRPDRPDAGHRVLHRQRGRGRPQAVVAIEPAGDGIAGEVDDVATVAIELLDDGVEDAAQVGGEFLCAPLRAELVRERIGQWREARDVGEQGRAADPVGHLGPGRERSAAVPGDVCLGFVAAELDVEMLHARPS